MTRRSNQLVCRYEQNGKKGDLSTNIGDGWQAKIVWRDEKGRVLEHEGDMCGCSLYETVYDAIGRVVT